MSAPSTVDRIFQRAAAEWPGRTHLQLDTGPVTYAESYERATRLAGFLAERGVRRGQHVAALLANQRELHELYIACGLVGAVAVPINTLSAGSEVARIARDCRAVALVAAPELLGIAASAAGPDLTTRVVASEAVAGWVSYAAALSAAPVARSESRPEEPAVVVYSSGTTGEPKGIVMGHRELVRNAELTSQVLGYHESDVFLGALPTFSSFGLSWDLLQIALVGGQHVPMWPFDPDHALTLIEQHRVTSVTGVPTMFARLFDTNRTAERDLSSLRIVDVGGGPVSNALKDRLRSRFGIEVVESYGLSEICPVASVERPDRPRLTGSCGPPLPTVEAEVVAPGGGEKLPHGERGELLLRSDTLMHGYLGKPEQTAMAIQDGWLHTGDIARIDADGNIYILDRLKDVIVSSGYNVYPKEVENVLHGHPMVRAAAVAGIPDPTRGQIVHAFVVLQPTATATGTELIEHCRTGLARFKIPRAVTFLDALPLTATGKIQRFRLVELVDRAEAQA